jgi:hypothetical protein
MNTAEVLLVQSVGYWCKATTPEIVCRFEALNHLPVTSVREERISCLVWSGDGAKHSPRTSGRWREHLPDLTRDDAQQFLNYLSGLRLPSDSYFEGEVETPFQDRRVFLRVRRDAAINSYDIFPTPGRLWRVGGREIEILQALCRRLFALAQFAEYEDYIYGHDESTLPTV